MMYKMKYKDMVFLNDTLGTLNQEFADYINSMEISTYKQTELLDIFNRYNDYKQLLWYYLMFSNDIRREDE